MYFFKHWSSPSYWVPYILGSKLPGCWGKKYIKLKIHMKIWSSKPLFFKICLAEHSKPFLREKHSYNILLFTKPISSIILRPCSEYNSKKTDIRFKHFFCPGKYVPSYLKYVRNTWLYKTKNTYKHRKKL